MSNQQIHELALRLLDADSENEAISCLRDAGYWSDPKSWRLFGDRDGNYATIGNQQSRPEAALVEKLINSVDARLIGECLASGIDPESPEAPENIREAVARLIEHNPTGSGGLLRDWTSVEILEQSRLITVAITGTKAVGGNPCITIVDQGEGQEPGRFPETFLSIDRSNKLRIPFVQGKYNMGGTGALKYCGRHGLQLIISRRNLEIVRNFGPVTPTAARWGVTIVRRELPTGGSGSIRNSVYRYLAPVGADEAPERGLPLSFEADSLPLAPNQNKPYQKALSYGSALKMYEYDMKGFRSHVLMKGGLLSRLEALLPEIALPIRMHECRPYRGDEARSFENTLVGLVTRLSENRGDNLEDGYPTTAALQVKNERMTAAIYAFKEDRAESYTRGDGVILVVNGQTHGVLPRTFFERASVKMGRLASSLLVVLDCSELSVGAREDLFMTSRDRLSNGELRKAIEDELEDLVAKHPGLKELRERRRAEELDKKLRESKPLEDVLKSILKSSPSLTKLFLLGQRLSRPHRGDPGTEGPGAGTDLGAFEGKKHPTFFRFFKQRDGIVLSRTCEIGRRCRIRFETDVENNYFNRGELRGRYHVEVLEGDVEGMELDHTLTLHNGVANWSISVPDGLAEGAELTLQCSVTDEALVEPFANVAKLRLRHQSERGHSDGERLSRADAEGDGIGAGGAGGVSNGPGTLRDAGITLPTIIPVREDEWLRHGFDQSSACKAVDDGGSPKGATSALTFYINVDNRYLKTDMKDSNADAKALEAKFIFGNVLVGLAVIHDLRTHISDASAAGDGVGEGMTAKVANTTRALAPFLIPMIDYLGTISGSELSLVARAGDEG